MEQGTSKPKGVHRSAQEWRELVAAWERSGVSRRGWCAEHGVSIESLRRWVKRSRRSVDNAALVELSREPSGSTSATTVRLRINRSGELELSGPLTEELMRCMIRVMRECSDVH